MNYYAHSTPNPDKSDWQLLDDHLENVARLAAEFAAAFSASDWGRTAGLLHDSGKATAEFIARLEGRPLRVNHSIFGARLSAEQCGRLGLLLSYIVAGHHGGLPDGGMQEGQLHFRLKQERLPDYVEVLPVVACPADLKPPFTLSRDQVGFTLSFFTRMLFSCLTDADFLDTEAFCSPEKAGLRNVMVHSKIQAQAAQLPALQTDLNKHLDHLLRKADSTPVNILRRGILEDCRSVAASQPGFFSLTVPTGGGKTLSSLAFALDHAVPHGLRRIIYAIPFTSIIEQNAKVFSDILGRANVLEHHCNYRDKDAPEDREYDIRRGLVAENWDAPVVVTTNVQFFESLFSNKPSRCRKLHNIARSVIILDEAQAIPTEYLEPCLAALRELVDRYDCTVVLCTATQPALDDPKLRTALRDVREIIVQPDQLYEQLKRTHVRFVGKLSNAELATRLDEHEQVLCIASTKPQAKTVFEQLANRDGAFHLSTNMTPIHRRHVLAVIRGRLQDSLPCRVISTSLIEAGVDVDFPVVYRAMAGMDSIAQAAGRCNREGRLIEGGKVVVFEPEQPPKMPWLQRCASRAAETLRTMPDADPLGLEVMRRYFELLYDVQDLDGKQILKRLNAPIDKELILPFKKVARDFRFIDDEGTALIIPLRPAANNLGLKESEDAQLLIRELRHTEFPRSTLRKLQQYSVTVRSKDLTRLHTAGAVDMIHDQYPVLRNLAAYDRSVGLRVDGGDVWEPSSLIL
ncbi:CRISPR-associated helicase, Cas3 family [Desulfonatronum thiosulfatophilum]|uniref:CRISPR-associated helicase, Cas3 family n=1 Tax=Desulfonatronum thiosulfatophilum TaxID=617002 RepID=A0A1G6EV61_9BACT|nr:CRISPR-associated helicase/endonuclease Cas3 [Desulfonatronum thiosulfatophilum]SDB61281.1 CRISPR-associated helicase, Cas3 family [Desulfonatronum thiosulfatophilum]